MFNKIKLNRAIVNAGGSICDSTSVLNNLAKTSAVNQANGPKIAAIQIFGITPNANAATILTW